MSRKKKPVKNPYAKDVRTPKYKMRVVKDKKKAANKTWASDGLKDGDVVFFSDRNKSYLYSASKQALIEIEDAPP